MPINALQPNVGVDGDGKSVTGYTITQATSVIGCTYTNYVRKMISTGRVKIVGKQWMNDDKTQFRLLLDVKTVEFAASKYEPREEDAARAYEVRFDPEQLAFFKTAFPKVKLKDLTLQRKNAQQRYHARQKAERKAKREAFKQTA